MRRLPNPSPAVVAVGLSLLLAGLTARAAPPATRPNAATTADPKAEADRRAVRAMLDALHEAERRTGVQRVWYDANDGSVIAVRLTTELATEPNVRLLPTLPNLRSVTVYAPARPITPQALADLARLPGLEALELCGASDVTDAATIRRWADLASLTSLSLKYTRLPPDAVAALADLRGLRTLDLAFTDVTDASLPALARLRGLTDLSVTGTNVTRRGVSRIGMRAKVRGAK